MKVAFELGLEGCSAIYVLNINNSTSREWFNLMNFHEWKCKKKMQQFSGPTCTYRPRALGGRENSPTLFTTMCHRNKKYELQKFDGSDFSSLKQIGFQPGSCQLGGSLCIFPAYRVAQATISRWTMPLEKHFQKHFLQTLVLQNALEEREKVYRQITLSNNKDCAPSQTVIMHIYFPKYLEKSLRKGACLTLVNLVFSYPILLKDQFFNFKRLLLR